MVYKARELLCPLAVFSLSHLKLELIGSQHSLSLSSFAGLLNNAPGDCRGAVIGLHIALSAGRFIRLIKPMSAPTYTLFANLYRYESFHSIFLILYFILSLSHSVLF